MNTNLLSLWSRTWRERALAAVDRDEAFFCLSMSARYQAIAEHLIRHDLADRSEAESPRDLLTPAFEFRDTVEVRREA